MRRQGFWLGLTIALVASVQPATAKSSVNSWLCKIMKPPFEPVAAIASFPLEKLPPATESREEKPSDSKRYTYNSYEMKSEGENYTVDFRYQFRSDDVSNPYGYRLTISPSFSKLDEFNLQSDKWLSEFGKPERSPGGRAVYAGPEIYEGGDPVFTFVRAAFGQYGAAWWSRGDTRYAAELCK